jgi:transcriptional regulator with XRE-family HTH domain
MISKPLSTTEEWERRVGADARRLRQRSGLTQLEMAVRANVSLSTIKYFEAGKGSSLATLIRIARVLDRSEWLASFAPNEPAVSPMSLLRERQREESSAPTRVRHSRSGPK